MLSVLIWAHSKCLVLNISQHKLNCVIAIFMDLNICLSQVRLHLCMPHFYLVVLLRLTTELDAIYVLKLLTLSIIMKNIDCWLHDCWVVSIYLVTHHMLPYFQFIAQVLKNVAGNTIKKTRLLFTSFIIIITHFWIEMYNFKVWIITQCKL